MPISLGNVTRRCQIPWDARFPVTPDLFYCGKMVRVRNNFPGKKTFVVYPFQIRCNSRLNRFCKFWAGGRVVRISPGYASYVMRTLLRTPSGYSTFKFIPSTGCHIIIIIIIALQYRNKRGTVEKQHGNKRQLY